MADALANDDVKYVPYAIVFTKPGYERVMPCGEGSMVLTETFRDTEFIAGLLAKYTREILKKDDKDQCKVDYRSVLMDPADAKYLQVYFVNPASWPREPLRKNERQARALEQLRNLLRTD
jgi:hypothetical protein